MSRWGWSWRREQGLSNKQGWKVSTIERHSVWSPAGACCVASCLRIHLFKLYLSSYCVLSWEPLHHLKGYSGAVLSRMPSVLQSSLKVSVGDCLGALWKKSHLYGCDSWNALIQVAHILVQTVPLALLQTSSLALCKYLKSFIQRNKIAVQYSVCSFVLHQLLCELFGETSVGVYFHALLVHCPVQHELVCSRSTNVESEERIPLLKPLQCTRHEAGRGHGAGPRRRAGRKHGAGPGHEHRHWVGRECRQGQSWLCSRWVLVKRASVQLYTIIP